MAALTSCTQKEEPEEPDDPDPERLDEDCNNPLESSRMFSLLVSLSLRAASLGSDTAKAR